MEKVSLICIILAKISTSNLISRPMNTKVQSAKMFDVTLYRVRILEHVFPQFRYVFAGIQCKAF